MARATELAGFVGAALAGLAYIPQIWHLIHERCSAGLSRLAFSLWLTASILVTSHAVAIGEAVFVALGAVQLAATTLILAYTTKYAGSYCASHLPVSLTPAVRLDPTVSLEADHPLPPTGA
ncbi:MAG: PQ-loop repeat-containing protein [Acidimicrobiales bacterium]|nr:PQ-loop repeat-containing protein [Acidimicrobiales bacterium]MCB1015235.1 PQ-loop repeat-containing protein [Acidimicrobiales bacterium]